MNDDALLEETVDKVTEGRTSPAGSDPKEASVEEAVAAATRAFVGSEVPPAALRERLRRDVDLFAVKPADSSQVVSFPAAGGASQTRANVWFPRRAWGWQLAAAAAVVFGLWNGFRSPPAVEPPPASVLRETVASAPDGIRAPFVPGLATYAGLDGDVVWSTTKQDGFLRLRGLPANDPQRSQYQLWIVDPERDAEFPVDGGVFDIPAGSDEALIRFQPRLPIGRPVAFVITQEIPGGVVKSRNPKPVAIAKL
jgi:hypothetical protein